MATLAPKSIRDRNAAFNNRLDKRLFFVIAVTACITNFIGVISSLIAQAGLLISLITAAFEVLYIGATLLGLSDRLRTTGAFIIHILNGFLQCPLLVYLYGASRTVFFIMFLLGVIYTLPKKVHFAFFFISLLEYIAGMFLHFFKPYFPAGADAQLGFYISGIYTGVIVIVAVYIEMSVARHHRMLQNERLVALSEDMEEMAVHDELTQVYNRVTMVTEIRRLLDSNAVFSLVIIDIDDFKKVNDSFGHSYGDEVLKVCAKGLKNNFGNFGKIFRFGGEEFLITCVGLSNDEIVEALSRANNFLYDYGLSTKHLNLHFSGGVAGSFEGRTIDSLIDLADERLYVAKGMPGKNQIITKTPKMEA